MAAGLVLAGCQQQAPDATTLGQRTREPSLVKLASPPPAPNLGGYVEVPSDDYLVTEQYEQYVSFQTPDGLTCRIEATAGCDGPLPGAPDGENEIYVDFSGRQVGMRKTDSPRFETPGVPGTIRQLPAQHRIDYTYERDCTCLATSDGGVGCIADIQGQPRGFCGVVARGVDLRRLSGRSVRPPRRAIACPRGQSSPYRVDLDRHRRSDRRLRPVAGGDLDR